MNRRGKLWDQGKRVILYPDDWQHTRGEDEDDDDSSESTEVLTADDDGLEEPPEDADPSIMDVDRNGDNNSPGCGHLPNGQKCFIPLDATVNSDNCSELARVLLTEDGHTPNYETGRGMDDIDTVPADRDYPKSVLQKRYRAWLDSMPTWENGLSDEWTGTRVLGRGGFGIAGLWEYTGDVERLRVGRHRYPITQVVVKQERVLGNRGQRREGMYMKMLNKTGSKHFPKLYKRVYRAAGAGSTNIRIDSSRREVHRMFMEYCAGGDLQSVIDAFNVPDNTGNYRLMREDKLWSIFLCFAKAVMIMSQGSENPDADAWGKNLVHFDIKPLNTFIGQKTFMREHKRMPIHKIGDLGLMTEPPQIQTTEWIRYASGRGTRAYLAPEQKRRSYKIIDNVVVPNKQLDLTQRCMGPHTNIYGIGTIMYCMMTMERSFPTKGITYISHLNENLSRGETIGADIEFGRYGPWVPRYRKGSLYGQPIPDPNGNLPERLPRNYSNELIGLVLECLMQDYRLRPTPKQLLQRVEAAYEMALIHWAEPEVEAYGEAPPGNPEPGFNLQEPTEFISRTPDNEWIEVNVRGIKYQPLQAVLWRQDRDKKRKEQRSKALKFRSERQKRIRAERRRDHLAKEAARVAPAAGGKVVTGRIVRRG